jgi:hypothetical protein
MKYWISDQIIIIIRIRSVTELAMQDAVYQIKERYNRLEVYSVKNNRRSVFGKREAVSLMEEFTLASAKFFTRKTIKT